MTRAFKDCEKHGPYRLYEKDTVCSACAAGEDAYPPEYLAKARLEAQANSLFYGMWHTIMTISAKEGTPKNCYWCKQPATTTAMVNIWGTIHITPCCAAHHRIHNGIARDDL